MIRKFRRVVTGIDDAGRSTFISDKPMAAMGEDPNWPTRGVIALWNIDSVPASNEGNVVSEAATTPRIIPGPGGLSFIIMHIPPESELTAMPPEQRARATIPVARTFEGPHELDTTQGYHMHATDTVDLCIVLQGEVTFYVDDGQVTLKQFDTIIDRGANHGWINHGKETCLVACAVIDTKKLNRDVYKKVPVLPSSRRDSA
jgi:quercetin dioxygenase-like cupin family protein